MDHLAVSGMFCASMQQSTLKKKKKPTQKPQSNLFSGSIEFPCQQSDSRTSISTNIPSILLLQPSGKRLFFFFSWAAPVQNQIFADKFEFSVFTDLSVSEVSTHPFIYIRGCRTCAGFTAHWKRVEKPFIETRAYCLPARTSGNSTRSQDHTCKA